MVFPSLESGDTEGVNSVANDRSPSPPHLVSVGGDDLLDHPVLTLMGLVLESAAGAESKLEPTLAPAGSALTPQLFEPLFRLARTEGGALRMTDLAAQCRYSPSAVTRVSDRLEELGLAERRACPTDRRVVHLSITPAGRAAVGSTLPEHVRVIDDEVFGTLSGDERAELDRLLRKVRDAVHPCAAAQTPSPGERGAVA